MIRHSSKQVSPELFEWLESSSWDGDRTTGKRVSFWGDVWRRFWENKGAVIGLIIVLLVGIMALLGPAISPHTYYEQRLEHTNEAPSWQFWFGTDDLGRDLWTRTWYGAGVSLQIALLAALIDLILGVSYGSISGYFGGRLDLVMQRMLEVLYGIPTLIIIILILIVFEPGIVAIALAMSVTGWINMARVVRGQMLTLKTKEFILAASALGASHYRILMKHLFPNAMGPVIVMLMFTIPQAIFFEAFLSFIGLGIRPPEASLGMLVQQGFQGLQFSPIQLIIPATVLGLIMLGFNLLGDGLRDALDPKLRR